MKKHLRYFLPLLLLVGCQNADSPAPFDPAVQPDRAALVSRKLYFWSLTEKEASRVEEYEYDNAGRLLKISDFARMPTGKRELNRYQEYAYDGQGNLILKADYYKDGLSPGWNRQIEVSYEYNGNQLSLERHHVLYPTGRQLISSARFEFRDGKKVARIEYDAQDKLMRRVEYRYTRDLLEKEISSGPDGQVWSQFVNHYRNNYLTQIEEFGRSTVKRFSLREYGYDEKGRLSWEQTKEVNPLYCAMVPGLIRYEY